MLKLAACIALVVAPAVAAQVADGPPQPGADGVYERADTQPTIVGGLAGVLERVVYPKAAREEGIEGMVVVQFVVAEDGSTRDAGVLRAPDDRLADAALAAVAGSAFTPGTVDGRAVPVRMALPVTFRLPSEDRTTSTSDRGMTISWDATFSDNVEPHLDRRLSSQVALQARVMGRVAHEGPAFEGLGLGTAVASFEVSDDGRAVGIEVTDAATPVLERFVRFHALAARFAPEAAGMDGTLTVQVTRVSR